MGASIIKKASIQDIPEIIGILENRVNWLKKRKIDQWNDGYTQKYNYQYFEDKMKKGDDVYIVFHDEKPTACMMLEKKSDFFKDVFTFNCYLTYSQQPKFYSTLSKTSSLLPASLLSFLIVPITCEKVPCAKASPVSNDLVTSHTSSKAI